MHRLILILALFGGSRSLANQPPLPTGKDLDGQIVAPLNPSSEIRAVVLFFTAPDCPIANRYAPAIQRLAREFEEHHIQSWLVYADYLADADAIRKHRSDFDFELPAVIDRSFEISDYVQADVTPEAIVIVFSEQSRAPTIVYRGRIDNQYQGFGKFRPVATQHDLRDLLEQIATGNVPRLTATKAI
ncbi:MAG: redoxin domain-containing protein, partial [Opitutaceae bacterium]